jgi:SWI/SNF-related matrix-associated actin-dependent regulator 1 of chromatin subfamily A
MGRSESLIVDKYISLGDTEILLRSPFIREEVRALKETVPNARWDRIAQVWRIPIMDRELAVDFAFTWDYEVTDELIRMDLPKSPTAPPNVKVTAKSVIINFPYDVVKIAEVKKIPNTSWHSDSKTWRTPLSSLVEVAAFAEEFNLSISDDVVEETTRIHAARERALAESLATDSDFHVPGLGLTPFPYQRAGIEYAVKKRRTFIADEMGLGKTLQALATVEATDQYPCVVVVPPSLLLNWEFKINEALPQRTVCLVRGRGDFPEHDTDFTVIGWSNITHHQDTLELRGYKGAIFDESQAYKNYQAQRTIAARKIAQSVPQDGVVLLLTGTPITGRPTEYEPQLDMMGRLGEFGGRWMFFKRFCGAYQDEDKRWRMDGTIPKGRLKELNTLLRQTCYVRRLKKDVAKDLPDLMDDFVHVELSPKWQKEYDAAEMDIVNYFGELKASIAAELGEDATEAKIRARIAAKGAEHLVRISVLKRITASGKMEAAQEWIDLRVAEGNKVIVGAHHRDVTEALAAANGGLSILGGQKVESVEEDKKKFQELSCEEAPVIVLSIQAAKTGHDLFASSHVLELELPWVPTDEDQLFGRAHRIGQKNAVLATRMVASGTIDIDNLNLLEKKRRIVEEAVDGKLPEERNVNLTMEIVDKFLDRA